MPLGLLKIGGLILWGVVELGVQGVKAYNLKQTLKAKEKEKKDEKLTK